MLAEIIYFLVYVGIIVGSYFGFKHLIKIDTGVKDLEGSLWIVTVLASISIPDIVVGILKLLLSMFIALVG